jgi:hypothetical protein
MAFAYTLAIVGNNVLFWGKNFTTWQPNKKGVGILTQIFFEKIP